MPKGDPRPTSPTAAAIRAARVGAGLTQTAAAGLVETSLRAWQHWEAGDREMHPGLWTLFQCQVRKLKR